MVTLRFFCMDCRLLAVSSGAFLSVVLMVRNFMPPTIATECLVNGIIIMSLFVAWRLSSVRKSLCCCLFIEAEWHQVAVVLAAVLAIV